VGKSRRGEREFGREKKLAHENKRLKQQVSQLRKMLARVDLDRYSNLKQTIEKHYQEEQAQEGQDILDKVKKEWACQVAGCEGYLEIILYNKIDSTWYYRRCNCCPHRTKSQKYSPEVKGIIKDSK
jgi:hypothetical protein